MSKIIFISNRLPVTVTKSGKSLRYQKSIGGLATGLKSYHEESDSLWVGWSGIAEERINQTEKQTIFNELKENYKCLPVPLTKEDINKYYNGFSNNTIWPLFHYFTNKVEYEYRNWEAYKRVNEKFFETVDKVIHEKDTIWIHDYQLMLLPQMIKEKYPEAKVGFFLHIPFPSYEIFRLLIWREEILRGLLGADLIGFHTYDYVRHFLSSASRILGLEYHLNRISYEDRIIQVDTFPMGIDYEYFNHKIENKRMEKQGKDILGSLNGTRMILSIDRLDYTKGIPERIKAFERFLEKYPEYREKVRLNLIVAPSRVKIDTYEELRREITELVSGINGKFGTFSWMPIWYFFQSFSQDDLISFYRKSDVLLVTPLRDGMNLVVKEYIAARNDYMGMAVISETAGAASELGEAVIVNPNDYNAIAAGIKTALEIPKDEMIARNKIMHRRLSRYNVKFWAGEFLNTLDKTANETKDISYNNADKDVEEMIQSYQKASKRILFLDYDGTLVGFKPLPEQAKPDQELKELLLELNKDPKNTVILASGRDRKTLEQWLGDLELQFIAAHGLWIRQTKERWKNTIPLDNYWKESIRHILEMYTDRLPGSLIEEKDYSLAWHYRNCEPTNVAQKLGEIKDALLWMTRDMNLGIQEGNKVLEVKDIRVNKGYGASFFLQKDNYDFIFGAGDDTTDEDLFSALPEDAYSLKVGAGNSQARYRTKSYQSMRKLLRQFAGKTDKS